MKTLLRLLPLILFIVIMLAVRLSGCHLVPTQPSETTTNSTSATTGQTTSPAPTIVTPSVTTAPTTVEPTTVTPTTTTPITTAPTTTEPTPSTTTAKPSTASNASQSWYYSIPSPLNVDKPANLSSSVSRLIAPYDVMWQQPIAGRKVVYLTMDQGYEYANNTTSILNTAKLKGVPITFFLTGTYIQSKPDLVFRMVEEGHLLANHSLNHPDMVKEAEKGGSEAVMREIHSLEAAYRDLTGQELAHFFRPPMGVYSEFVLDTLTREGYSTVFWSFAYRDWLTDDQPDPVEAKNRILGQLHDGSVILLHSVSTTNTNILGELIDEIRARGYEFALLDESR